MDTLNDRHKEMEAKQRMREGLGGGRTCAEKEKGMEK